MSVALDLDAGRIAHEGFRVSVDATMRSTSNPSVYLCGDVLSGPPQLSPVATYEGRLVGRNIVEGPKYKPDYSSLPTAVYTVPALATVGLSEAKAKEKGLQVRVQVNDMEYWFSTRQFAETVAWSKIIVDEGSDVIVGAHFVGHAGEELINIFGLAMKHGIKGKRDPRFHLRLSDLLRRHQVDAVGARSAPKAMFSIIALAISCSPITTRLAPCFRRCSISASEWARAMMGRAALMARACCTT